ncbi:MAG: hypothetical protein RL226_2214 [Bacteroidota bacterium]
MTIDRAVVILYGIGLSFMAVAMSFSNLLMSIASFWLLGAWVIDHLTSSKVELKMRWSRALRNSWLYFLLGLFLLHAIAMIWTDDLSHGWRDLRIKLPLLLFPVVFFTARRFPISALRFMLKFLLLGAAIAALACMAIPAGLWEKEVKNVRDISVFISHIRFSVLLVFGFAVILPQIRKYPYYLLAVAIYFGFLWTLESVTGFMLSFVVFLIFLFHSEHLHFSRKLRKAGAWLLATGSMAVVAVFGGLAIDYFNVDEAAEIPLQRSRQGEEYAHNLENFLRENEHYIWRNIAWGELHSSWPTRSNMPLDSLDGRGQLLNITLIRYLTSKGLLKDADGVASLTDEDIHNIESGIPSILELQHSGMRRRVDKILFETDNYLNGGNPSGNSIFQRFEFWRAATHIISQHPVLGVGTGDVGSSMQRAYEEINTQLLPDFRLRPHNQYLTFWVAFGVAGPVLLLMVFLKSLFGRYGRKHYLFVVFTVLMMLSFLTEDTLETQAGVTFFAFFIALFASGQLQESALITSSAENGN